MNNYQDEYFRKKRLLDETGVKDESGPTPPSAYSKEAMNERIMNREKALSSDKAVADPAQKAADMKQAGIGQAAQIATANAGDGGMGTVAGGMGAVGLMTGNPYLAGAGLGLSVLAQVEQGKRQREEQERQAYNQRIADRQKLMQQIASQGIQ